MTRHIVRLESLPREQEESWENLVSSNGFNPSCLPRWVGIVEKALGSKGVAVSVFVDRNPDGSIEGFVPYFINWKSIGGLPMRVLQLGTNRVSYHVELVAIDPTRTLARFLAFVQGWDLFHAANVNVQAPTFKALQLVGTQYPFVNVAKGESSPYVPLRDSWADLIASKGKKFRYKLRKRAELLQLDSAWKMLWMDGMSSKTVLADIFAIEKKSWKASEGLDIPSRPQEAEYHRRLIPFLLDRGWLFGNVLHCNDTPIAYSLCCHAGTWIGQLKTSFDISYEEYSPGAIVIDACIEQAFARGATEFDFLGDATQHKLAWTDHAREHVDVFIAGTTILGRSYAALKKHRSGNFVGE